MAADNTELLWLREDLQYIRDKVDAIDKNQDTHEKNCPALKSYNKKPSSTSMTPPIKSKAGFLSLAKTFGPIFLAAALGLLGLGAYLGGNDVSDIEEKVKELTQLVKKGK